MRKQVNLGTYSKIKEFFLINKDLNITQTYIRDELDVDYYSVKLVLDILIKERFIKKNDNKYKLNTKGETENV